MEFVALASKSIMFCSFCGGEDVDGAVGVASVWTTGAGAGVDPGVASAVAEAGATAGAGGSGFFTTISSPVSGCTMASALVDLCGGTCGRQQACVTCPFFSHGFAFFEKMQSTPLKHNMDGASRLTIGRGGAFYQEKTTTGIKNTVNPLIETSP